MTELLSGPWLVRSDPFGTEVRLLVRGTGPEIQLEWEGVAAHPPREIVPTHLGPMIRVARWRLPASSSQGGRYRIHTAEGPTGWIAINSDPLSGDPWRFLILSDHHGRPAARRTLQAIDRGCHGILFAGDVGEDPDELATWIGGAGDSAFLDTMSAPVAQLFSAAEICAGPLAHAPILATPGNHDVAITGLIPPAWDVATFTALFAPPGGDAPRGCFAASLGPLRVFSLLVACRWAPGDHELRVGPCYEPPGRFIFQPLDPAEPLVRWVAGQRRSGGRIHVALMHHSPYAQGWNALPFFGDPLEYRENLIVRHLLPVLEPWADLVISGHNHAVNHHRIGGIDYFEASQMAMGLPPCRVGPDGAPAPEPSGHPACFFTWDAEATFYAQLEIGAQRAQISVHRVSPEGACAQVYRFDLAGV